MAFPSVTYTFANSTASDGPNVSQNFSDLVNGLSDGTKDLSMNAATFAGTLTANGNVVLGNSSSDTLTVTASLGSHLVPSANVTYDLGSSTLGMKLVYLGGTGAFTVALKASASLGANYTFTFPLAVPTFANTTFLTQDTAGVVTNTARIVMGRIGSMATILTGGGFTAARASTGEYTVSFNVAFDSANFAVTAQLFCGSVAFSGGSVNIISPPSSGVVTFASRDNLDSLVDRGFSFTAMQGF